VPEQLISRTTLVARCLFAAGYVAAQVALIATAGGRPEHAFGFRMFSESSTVRLHLLRAVEAPSGHGTVLVDVRDGAWNAHDPSGAIHRFAWRDRVREPELGTFDVTMHAAYGAEAQLARLRAALADVARHVPEDAETRELVLNVTVRQNGKEPEVVLLRSGAR